MTAYLPKYSFYFLTHQFQLFLYIRPRRRRDNQKDKNRIFFLKVVKINWRRLNFQVVDIIPIMDQQRSRCSLLHESINHCRSTSDLIPKCRSEALKEKRATIRSKINYLAKQIYQLKYDQEWESHKLQQLSKKAECIFQQAEQKLKEVMDQSKILGTLQSESSNSMSLELTQLSNMQLKGSAFAASERSTQPQVNDSYLCEKKEVSYEKKKQRQKHKRSTSSNYQQKKNTLNTNIIPNSSMTRSLKNLQSNNIPIPSRKTEDKIRMNKDTIINISIFAALLLIVLLLL